MNELIGIFASESQPKGQLVAAQLLYTAVDKCRDIVHVTNDEHVVQVGEPPSVFTKKVEGERGWEAPSERDEAINNAALRRLLFHGVREPSQREDSGVQERRAGGQADRGIHHDGKFQTDESTAEKGAGVRGERQLEEEG